LPASKIPVHGGLQLYDHSFKMRPLHESIFRSSKASMIEKPKLTCSKWLFWDHL